MSGICYSHYMTSQEIKKQIRETRKEMKAKGIRRIACFNGGLSGEAYSLNARMFDLETKLDLAIKLETKLDLAVGRRACEYGNAEIRWPDGLQHY